jgi:hypothetical protein
MSFTSKPRRLRTSAADIDARGARIERRPGVDATALERARGRRRECSAPEPSTRSRAETVRQVSRGAIKGRRSSGHDRGPDRQTDTRAHLLSTSLITSTRPLMARRHDSSGGICRPVAISPHRPTSAWLQGSTSRNHSPRACTYREPTRHPPPNRAFSCSTPVPGARLSIRPGRSTGVPTTAPPPGGSWS